MSSADALESRMYLSILSEFILYICASTPAAVFLRVTTITTIEAGAYMPVGSSEESLELGL